MRSLFVAVAALTVSLVSGQANIVSVTSPLAGTVYTAGKPAIISWINPTVDTIPAIVLAQGNPNALQPVTTIAQNVDAQSGSYTWNIPANFTPGTDYALELGTSPNISFTGLFTIQAGDGTAPSSSANASASSAVSSSVSATSLSTSVTSSVLPSSFSTQVTTASSSPSPSKASSSPSPSTTTNPNAASKQDVTLMGIALGAGAVAMLLM